MMNSIAWMLGDSVVSFPAGWVVTAFGALALAIATLATIMWDFMKNRLAAQDEIIKSQGFTIDRLQNDVDRLSKGCGQKDCLWRGRN